MPPLAAATAPLRSAKAQGRPQGRAVRRAVKTQAAAKKPVKKVVLAYSGGLDTSIILKWLQDQYECEVVTFTADIGQGEEVEPARAKAEALGVKEIFIDDLREEFVKDYVFPMFRGNALYEGTYLLGTSIARPLIAKRQIEIAEAVGADAVSHGATGKGNDQIRFELGYYALKPDIRVIAPWREWDLNSRSSMVAYADENGIPVPEAKRGDASAYSRDANLLHISHEGNQLEDPWCEPADDMWTRTVSWFDAPNEPTEIVITFDKGDPVAIDGEALSPAALLTKLNELGGANGVGRLDIVESRYVGMKSRGAYETPGGTVLFHARRALESICLDRGEMHQKDEWSARYSELVYNVRFCSALLSPVWMMTESRRQPVAHITRTHNHTRGSGSAQSARCSKRASTNARRRCAATCASSSTREMSSSRAVARILASSTRS